LNFITNYISVFYYTKYLYSLMFSSFNSDQKLQLTG